MLKTIAIYRPSRGTGLGGAECTIAVLAQIAERWFRLDEKDPVPLPELSNGHQHNLIRIPQAAHGSPAQLVA